MKRSFLGLLSFAVCIGLAGCNTPPKMDSDDSMFDYMQNEAAKIADDGGMAAVGLGESPQRDFALSKAKMAARRDLAQQVSVKVENLEKSFVEEIGEASTSEINTLFSSATKQITDKSLQGTVPMMQKYEEDGGVVTAYVLMVLNPKVVDESLKNIDASKHLYERFRASKAFEELDKEIKEYEAAEMQGFGI